MTDKPQTADLTSQIGGTDLIVCPKCGWTHMRLMVCNATPDDGQKRMNDAARELLKTVEVQKIMANPKTTRPTWVVAADMPSSQRAWYWAEFPGSWAFYSPEMNATRDIDQGNTGWHPLISGRYWGPWTEHTLAALQLEVAHVAGTAPREAVPPVPAQMMFPHTYSTLEPPRQMEASMKAIKDALDAGYQNAVAALEDVAGCFGDEQAQATVRAAAKILTRVKPQ